MKMDTVFCALLALILFLLCKIIETNFYLSQLNYKVKKTQLQNDKEKSRTLQEVRNATKLLEQVSKQFENKEEKEKTNDNADTTIALKQNESDKFNKVVHRSVGPHNNNNTYLNINFNLFPPPSFSDFSFQTLRNDVPNERLIKYLNFK